MKEIWKEVPKYDGMYLVSNLGNIKSKKTGKEKLLKPALHRDGYYQIVLTNNDGGKTKQQKLCIIEMEKKPRTETRLFSLVMMVKS